MKLFISALVIFLFTGCSNLDENTATFGAAEKWIPADFDPRASTLLIQNHTWGGKYQDKMKTYLKDKYPYPYELYTMGSEPADPSKYKFRVVWENDNTKTSSNIPGGTHLVGHFENISTGKKYRDPKYSNYGALGYMPFFNSIIKKYKTK